MARVESLGEFFHFTNTRRKKKGKSEPVSVGRFADLVSDSVGASSEVEEANGSDLEDLVDDVHSAGDDLADTQSTEAIAKYRRAVQRLLRFVVRRAYVTERHRSRPSVTRGTQKEYTLIRTIDGKLEELTGELLRGQLQGIDVLKRVEEIRGLVVDLVR